MNKSRSALRQATGPLPLLLLATIAGPALGHSYQTEVIDGHIARCTTINTTALPEASLQEYRLERDADLGLMTCMAQKNDPGLEPQNVPIQIRARVRPVGRTWNEIDLRAIRTNGLISYLGTYSIQRAEALQFEVMVEVPGVGGTKLQFDDLEPQR